MADLNHRQRAFCKAYTGEAMGCATKAARLAGYSHPTVQGPRLLRNVAIQAALAEVGPERPDIAEPSEVRATITAIMRTAERTADRLRAAEVLSKILPGLAVATRTSSDLRVTIRPLEDMTDAELDREARDAARELAKVVGVDERKILELLASGEEYRTLDVTLEEPDRN